MGLLNVVIVLIIVGVLLWLVNQYIPMDAQIKKILNIVVIIATVLWILSLFIGIGRLNTIRVGSLFVQPAYASEIQWTRLKGTVKGANAKTQTLTIEDQAGDLLSLHIDSDVDVLSGKDPVAKLSDLKLGDKVTLLYNPKPPTPHDADEPAPGGVYKQGK